MRSMEQSGGLSARTPRSRRAVRASGSANREDIYVWQLPVRITHWVNVFSIVILSITGYYIENPFIGTTGEASTQFLMGSVRFTHFLVAFIFTVSVLFRIYWAFRGNEFARWEQFVPVSRGRTKRLFQMMGYYTFLRKRSPAVVGHNPLAGLTYVVIYILFLLQIVTGFALYSMGTGGFWAWAFGWLITVFGAQPLRLVHTVSMFLLIAFTIHHVYSAILIDIEERSGLVSSIVTGYKSLTPEQLADAQDEPIRD